MEVPNGSSSNLNDSEANDNPQKFNKLNLKKKGETSKELMKFFLNKDDDSASTSNHHKKSPYVSTLQKIKRKVRNKNYSFSESSTFSENNHKSTSSRPASAASSEKAVAENMESLLQQNPIGASNNRSESPLNVVNLSEQPATESSIKNVYDEDNSYEETIEPSVIQDNSRNDIERQKYVTETISTSKEDEDKKSYVYVDMNELFERPNLREASVSTNLQAPLLCPFQGETDSQLSSDAGQEYGDTESKKAQTATARSSERFQYSDPKFPTQMQDSIRELALDGQFADVTIEVEDRRIKCHRMILAAASQYFKAMFCNPYLERDQASVKIQEVSAEVMKILIRYAYTSYLEVRCEQVQSVLEAASLLQFTRVMEACCNYFVGELSIENAPGFMELSHRHNLNNLLVLARLKCVTCFKELRTKSDYLTLSLTLLESLISRDDLETCDEKEVFKVIMSWCEFSVEKRKKHLSQLLQHVKLPLLDPVYFVREVETHPLIQNNPDVFDLLMEARLYHASAVSVESTRIVPRKYLNTHQVFVTVGGCNRDDEFVSDVAIMDFQHKTRAVLCKLPNAGNSAKIFKTREGNETKATRWTEFACTSWKGNIVLSGGKATKREVWMFITALRQWVELADLNTGRWRHRMVVCKGELYVVGGYDGLLRVDSLEKYNERENEWFEQQPMKEGVSSAAICECLENIYVMGGGPSIKVSTEKVQVYNPSTDTWALSTPMPEPAKCINSVSLRGVIYVVGGTLKNVFRFDPEAKVWDTVGRTLLSERASCGITICNNWIFIVGGRDDKGKALSNVSYLDTNTETIHSECNMACGLSHHGCLTLEKYDHLRLKPVGL